MCGKMDLRSRVSSSESDGEAVDSSVKILINDVTPCDSREFLHLAGLRSQLASQNDISVIAQKQTAKDHRNRRASWAHTKRSDIPLRLHRSWSLGSLASHLEQMCYGPSIGLSSHNRFSTTKDGSSDSIPEGMREKQRSFSAGSREDVFMFCNQLQDSAQSMSDIITNDVSQTLNANISEPKSVKKHSLISFGNKNSRKEEWLIAPRSTLQKSISTPSIVAAQEIQEIAHRRDGRDSSYGRNRYLAQNIRNSCIEIMHEEDEPEEMNIKRLSNFSLANLLRENLLKTGAQDGEDDKSFSKRKKRGSLFFRKKKNKDKDKDNKKSPHQFVSICFSTAATCSVCSRALANKSALKCENCCIAVHDSSCKDHVPPCVQPKVNTNPSAEKDVNTSLLTSTGSIRYPSRYRQLLGAPTLTHSQSSINLGKHSQLSKEKRSSLTDINRVIVSSNPDPVKSSPTSSAPRKNYTPSGYSQWRRVATKLGVNKVICEEKEIVTMDENSTNMVETNSASIESLDETSQGTSDAEDDAMLQLLDEEPESWNGTVDKKVLKKLKERDVKRQEAIYELILTEKHHCLTLKVMQRVFAKGMIQELNVSKDMVQRIFPCLDELLRIHLNFLQRLRERQKTEPVVSHIGDIIAQQFEGQNAEELVSCYSQFCSQHTDALSLYKDILKSDRKFQSFVKKCGSKAFCKARGIPECILLVTQRVTKYPLLLDALIKTTKDNKLETEKLTKALTNVKNIIAQVNSAVAEKEREIRLLEIYNRIDAKSTAFYKKEKFKKSDLLSDNRKLRFEGTLEWKSARGKVIDVHVIILSDVIVLLQENNQKYTFASLDNKAAVISLQKLLVREKAGQNSRGIYLISSNPTYPEMYEMLCSTPKDKKLWLQVIRDSVTMLLTEGKGLFKSESTQNAMQADDEKSQKLAELCATMQEKDMEIANLCEEKIKAMLESFTLLGLDKHKLSNIDFQQLLQKDEEETEQALLSALSQACSLTSRVYYFDTNPYINPDDASSSVNMSPVLPKRAETFAGFDNSGKDATDKVNVLKKKLMQLKELDGDCHERELSSSDPSLHVKNKGETASNVKFISRLGSPERVRHSHSTKSSSQGGFNRIEEVAELNQLLATIMSLLQHQITLYRKEFGKKKYRPDNQLEELRNIQEKLSQERLQWENEKAKKEKELENKKAELILMEKRIQEQTKHTLHADRKNSCCHENQDMSQNCSSLSLCKHRRSASFDFRTLGTLTQEIGGRQSWSGPVDDTSFICHQRCYSSQSASNIGHDGGDSSVANSQNDSEHSEHFDFGSPGSEAKDPTSPSIFYESSKSMNSSMTGSINCPGRETAADPVMVQSKCLCPISLVTSSHRYKGCTLNGGESIQNNYCRCRDSL